MGIFTLGSVKNHKIKHLPPLFTMGKSQTRLQLKINHFSNFHVCSNYSLWGVNQSLPQICVIKLRSLQTEVDSDFSQNFCVKKSVGGGFVLVLPDPFHPG